MRAKKRKNGVTVKAYAGTTGVLLALNIDEDKRQGLLGFAIERRDPPANNKRWLQGLLCFEGQPHEPGDPIDSNKAPFQKFRWSDYAVHPDTAYEYIIHPVRGLPNALVVEDGPTVAVRTMGARDAEHFILFNRAAAASQAFSRKFPDLDEKLSAEAKAAKAAGRTAHAVLPPEALAWLSRGVEEQIVGFLGQALDPTWAVDVAIYEYELPAIVQAVEAAHARGAVVRLVYHAKKDDEQTPINEASAANLPAAVKRARVTSKIFHDKFIVLSKIAGGVRSPQAVLCGSTNFTENGVYRQANVVHTVTLPNVADRYLKLFDALFGGADPRATKRYINKHNPIVPGDISAIFAGFSPRSDEVDLQEFAAIINKAKRDVLFCTAFDLNATVSNALLGAAGDPILRYGLENTRSEITGFHADRSANFSATAMLNTGLEGFLKESTKGQRGNILIHTKLIVVDFTSDHPTIISGSHNLSRSASSGNDENYLILRGNPDVADCYGCELMRLYDHYRFRFVASQKAAGGQPQQPLFLVPDDSWTDRYFNPTNAIEALRKTDRLRFAGEPV